jgi:hypothetical protein
LKFQISDLKEKTDEQELVPTITHDTAVSALPVNPYAGRTTQEVIAEIEENYAREKAAKLNRQRPTNHEQKETKGTEATEQTAATQRGPTKRELSPYEQALLEGKTHLEAMYAQATPDGKPKGKEPEVSLYPKPNPLDAFSEPVRVTGFEYRREPIG